MNFIGALTEWLEINYINRPRNFEKYLEDGEWIQHEDNPYIEDDEDEIHEIQTMIDRYGLADKTNSEIMAMILTKIFYLEYLMKNIER